MSSSNVLNRAASLSSRRGRHTLLLRQQPHRRRFLSTNMAAAATNDNSPPLIVPVLHSRKALPRACTDPSELSDMTEHVLSAEVGNLFQFQRNTNVGMMSRLEESKAAWNTADGTVQLVEYLMRGHAAKVPGSLWNEWTEQSGAEDPLESLAVMDALVARMWDEGQFYMTVRQQHWSQVALEDDLLRGSAADESMAADWRKFAREDTIVDDNGDDAGWKAAEAGKEEGSDDNATSGDMMEDFAMPGPSVDMYDMYLDTIATAAALIKSQEDATPLLTSKHAFHTFETILSRHQLDGGDDVNTNRHTLPTQISYNAVMRTAANLPFDSTDDDLSSAEVYRDWALLASFSAHDALTQAAGLERNSSTYAYLLQVVAKYMPPSIYRGNVARGLWKLAKTNGVYNAQVQDALLLANATSNGPKHDEWLDENIRGKDWRTDAPHRWRRRVQKYRMVPKQTTY